MDGSEIDEEKMLNSQNIYLTALNDRDIPLLYEWIINREQVLFNAPYHPIHQLEHEHWFKEIQNRTDVVIFGIHLSKSNKLIGTC
jgi:hypothetical protein